MCTAPTLKNTADNHKSVRHQMDESHFQFHLDNNNNKTTTTKHIGACIIDLKCLVFLGSKYQWASTIRTSSQHLWLVVNFL
jgi:predicted RNase H-related nuclease YkuK (DUF458 family)